MRAAIYARMSTDKQSDASTTDQVRECRRFAERRGLHVVFDLVFEEAGISGASRHNRPRLLELVARIDEWDVLLAFDFSRLARNQEDLGWIRNRLRLHRREAFEASTGLELGNIGARVMGVVNEEYLEKLRSRHAPRAARALRSRSSRRAAAPSATARCRSWSGRIRTAGRSSMASSSSWCPSSRPSCFGSSTAMRSRGSGCARSRTSSTARRCRRREGRAGRRPRSAICCRTPSTEASACGTARCG